MKVRPFNAKVSLKTAKDYYAEMDKIEKRMEDSTDEREKAVLAEYLDILHDEFFELDDDE